MRLGEYQVKHDLFNVCVWRYESAQFAGGPFFSTSCGEYDPDVIHTPQICPYCGKNIQYKEDTDE